MEVSKCVEVEFNRKLIFEKRIELILLYQKLIVYVNLPIKKYLVFMLLTVHSLIFLRLYAGSFKAIFWWQVFGIFSIK